MDEVQTLKEIEKGIFSDKSTKSDFPWKNLLIGIGVVFIAVFLIYLTASSLVKSSDYKSLDLSTGKKDESVAGTSIQGPFGPPQNVTPTKAPVTPTPTPEPTTAPTATPTNKPADPTATPTSVPPTATPTPITPTPTTPSPSPSGDPTPTEITPSPEEDS